MDNGRDLSISPVGPWVPDKTGKSAAVALPVVQHHHKMAFRRIGEVDANNHPAPVGHVPPDIQPQTSLPQSTSSVPLQYSSLLSALDLSKPAKSSPLHALIPVFAHAAFSEVAFLNLITHMMDEVTAPLPLDNFRSDTFEKLQHYEQIVRRHASQLKYCFRSLRRLNEKNTERQPFPNSDQPSPFLAPRKLSEQGLERESHPNIDFQQSILTTSSFSATGILQDYEDLLDRCMNLLARIESAKASEMNRAQILESRRAIEQSERMKQLTQLATYFIPLTFTASLFGMNFDLLGQGELSVWWYFVFAVPFTILTHLVCSMALRTWIGRLLAWKENDSSSSGK
ncbi:hypothetical protein BJ166DRAFT_525799 [Pestalotiopsis sp. NC0098]|nr:hypothetical protein BJ166DRAFT_525799 [Pestalotiopsis sp. NC0098]